MKFIHYLYYTIYIFNVKSQRILLLPYAFLFKNEKIVKTLEKKNIGDPMHHIDSAINNPERGITSMWTGGLFYGTVFWFLLGSHNLFLKIIKGSFELTFSHFLIFYLSAFTLSYVFIERKGKYLIYYEQFNKMNKRKRVKWFILSSIVLLLIWILGIMSMFL